MIYVLNLVPTSLLESFSLYEALTRKASILSHLHLLDLDQLYICLSIKKKEEPNPQNKSQEKSVVF